MQARVDTVGRTAAWTWCLGVALAAQAAAETPDFSGERAYRHLAAIAALGPRPSGSPGIEKQRELIVAHFQAAGARVVRQPFQIRDRRTGQPVRMENLIVEFHPDRTDRVLLGTHYDTRPFPDRDPLDPNGVFLGVNDGGSGVAVLMELAAAVRELPGRVGVDFVLFDAEEYVFGPRDPYCLGSNFFARNYASARQPHRYRCGVILDMVADRDLEIFQEQHSVEWPDTRPVVDDLWGAASRLGVRQFVPRPKHMIEDDHVPLRMIGGIPTCDVIDFDFPQWHTTADTLEHCSAASLEAVGSVMIEWLRRLK